MAHHEAALLLDALLAALPDGVVLCDGLLEPKRAGAAAQWLLDPDGGWARQSAAAAHVREAAAAALDSHGVATATFDAQGQCWQARAAPLRHPACAVVVAVRPSQDAGVSGDAILRAAHDLKAPIHAIQGFAKLLLREAAGPLGADQRRFLELAASEATRLQAHLERLLDLARSGVSPSSPVPAATGPPRVADVAAAVQEAAARFAGAAAAREIGVRLDLCNGLQAAIAEDELGTIVENLLANAIAAGPRGSPVCVTVEPANDGAVRCRVVDAGPGIPEAALARIFEPYFRLPERGAPGGTGLGLAISRGLAEARGGRLVAANGAGGGAVFTLELPAAASQARTCPVLRLAPVASHRALSAARAALDLHLPAPWRILSWEGGVLALEVEATPARAATAAAEVARASSFACWLVS